MPMTFSHAPAPVSSSALLSWSRLDDDARPECDVKFILGEQDFRSLSGSRLSGSRAIRPSYYRGRDAAGNIVTVRVVADI